MKVIRQSGENLGFNNRRSLKQAYLGLYVGNYKWVRYFYKVGWFEAHKTKTLDDVSK